MANKLIKRQNDDLLSLFMELPARTDLIDNIDNDPLMNIQNTYDVVSNIDVTGIFNPALRPNESDSKYINSVDINPPAIVDSDDNDFHSPLDTCVDDDEEEEEPLSKYTNGRPYSLRESKKKRNVQEVVNEKKTRRSTRTRNVSKRIGFKKKKCISSDEVDHITSDCDERKGGDCENKCESEERVKEIEKKTEEDCQDEFKYVRGRERNAVRAEKKSKLPHRKASIGKAARGKRSKYKIRKSAGSEVSNVESVDSDMIDDSNPDVFDVESQEQENTPRSDEKISTNGHEISSTPLSKSDEELSNDERNVDDFFDEVVPEKKKKNLKKYTCIICNLLTSCKGAYKAHLLRKHDLIYVYGCVMCDMKFESMELLMAHRKNDHYDAKTNGFACTKCDRTFREFHKLVVHLKEAHELEVDKDVQYCVDKNVKTILNGTNVVGDDEESSRTVVFKTTATTKNRNGKEFKKTTKIKKPYKTSVCHLCGKVFNFLGQFKEHLLKHDNIKNYVCDVCQKAFISKRILTIHKKIHDSISDRKYVCGFVFNEFDESGAKKPHESERRCSEQASTEMPVAKDEYTQKDIRVGYKENDGTEVNRNSTDGDDKATSEARMSNRKTRKPNVDARITHNGAYIVTDEYGRRTCSFACVSKSDLNKHRLVHLNLKPFTCPICDMSFRQTAHLRRHIKRHTGTKEYKCDICKMEFVTKDNLNNHLRTHSDVLPFICEICGKTFLQRTQCMKHVRNCHPVRSKPYGQNYSSDALPGVEKQQCAGSVAAVQPNLSNCADKQELVNIVEPMPECNGVNASLGIWG